MEKWNGWAWKEAKDEEEDTSNLASRDYLNIICMLTQGGGGCQPDSKGPTQSSEDSYLASTLGGMKQAASDCTCWLRPRRGSWVQNTTGQWPFFASSLLLSRDLSKKHHLRATLVRPTVYDCQTFHSAQHVPRRWERWQEKESVTQGHDTTITC